MTTGWPCRPRFGSAALRCRRRATARTGREARRRFRGAGDPRVQFRRGEHLRRRLAARFFDSAMPIATTTATATTAIEMISRRVVIRPTGCHRGEHRGSACYIVILKAVGTGNVPPAPCSANTLEVAQWRDPGLGSRAINGRAKLSGHRGREHSKYRRNRPGGRIRPRPLVHPGEDPQVALAPGSARRRALDRALEELAAEPAPDHPRPSGDATTRCCSVSACAVGR